MSLPVSASPGAELAVPSASTIDSEVDAMQITNCELGEYWQSRNAAVAVPRTRILDSWKPSDRRRLGHLSFKAYEQSGMNCPTDLWSYQRLFIEQRRDDGNLWSGKPKAIG